MKETNYNKIREEIASQLSDNGNSLVEFIGVENTILCVMNIYLTNDITTGFGQNFAVNNPEVDTETPLRVSVISSPTRISIIIDHNMSYYKENEGVCTYESLEDDINEIFLLIQTTLDRIEAQID